MKYAVATMVGVAGLMAAAVGAAWAAEGEQLVLFDFEDPAERQQWEVEDDTVMGGRSRGSMSMHPDGYAVFAGDVSLENDGGFSSIQSFLDPIDVRARETAVLRLKGDGKQYVFIVEGDPDEDRYYVYPFETSGDWETIEIPLEDMEPRWRGDRLDAPNFPGRTLSQVRFLIGNKRAESFRLLIDSIALE